MLLTGCTIFMHTQQYDLESYVSIYNVQVDDYNASCPKTPDDGTPCMAWKTALIAMKASMHDAAYAQANVGGSLDVYLDKIAKDLNEAKRQQKTIHQPPTIEYVP
jgi:hypothetical protein